MLYLSLTPSELLTDPHGREFNATATEPQRELLAHLGEQLPGWIIGSIGADPMNCAMGIQGSANRSGEVNRGFEADCLWQRNERGAANTIMFALSFPLGREPGAVTYMRVVFRQ